MSTGMMLPSSSKNFSSCEAVGKRSSALALMIGIALGILPKREDVMAYSTMLVKTRKKAELESAARSGDRSAGRRKARDVGVKA